MTDLNPGDVIVYGGVTALVYARNADRMAVMPAGRDRGPRHRAEVEIGSFVLATVSGRLLVNVAAPRYLPEGVQPVLIGRIDNAQRAAVIAAVAREKAARRAEDNGAGSEMFAAAQPRFASGGRRVGAHVQ